MSALKRILVTGGNKGIGEALCKKLLADYSDTFVLLGSRNIERGLSAIESILSQIGDESIRNRLEFVQLDVSDDESVSQAASAVAAKFGHRSLYAIVNNAAIGFGQTLENTVQTNVFGPKRVTDAFLPLIDPDVGRIVNIASASGPMYVAKCIDKGVPVDDFINISSLSWESLQRRIEQAMRDNTVAGEDAYGFSKACLNAYTVIVAQQYPNLVVNSCTPGFIATDLTKGFGATNPPEKGTVAPLHCLFSSVAGTGCYYGSDAVRSPLDRYRGPGDAPYDP